MKISADFSRTRCTFRTSSDKLETSSVTRCGMKNTSRQWGIHFRFLQPWRRRFAFIRIFPFYYSFYPGDACNNNSTLKKRDGWKRREESRVRWCACESFFGILLCADAYTRSSTSCVSFFILQMVRVVPDFLSSGGNYVSGPLVYSLQLQADSFYYYVRNGSHASPLYSFSPDALQIYFLYLLPSLFSRYFSGFYLQRGMKKGSSSSSAWQQARPF